MVLYYNDKMFVEYYTSRSHTWIQDSRSVSVDPDHHVIMELKYIIIIIINTCNSGMREAACFARSCTFQAFPCLPVLFTQLFPRWLFCGQTCAITYLMFLRRMFCLTSLTVLMRICKLIYFMSYLHLLLP